MTINFILKDTRLASIHIVQLLSCAMNALQKSVKFLESIFQFFNIQV